MEDRDIHVGDVLYVKEWDEMLEEGHLDKDGDIEFHSSTSSGLKYFFFFRSMKYMCGTQFTVKRICNGSFASFYESEEYKKCGVYAVVLKTQPTHLYVASDDEIRFLLS